MSRTNSAEMLAMRAGCGFVITPRVQGTVN
jgi:hypothetical protein